jgi:hypothetical protein
MAIFTPRGLKIRLDIPYSFGLMSRLFPTVPAFTILKTAEGIENVPAVLAMLAGLIAFAIHLPPIWVFAFAIAAGYSGVLINTFGLYFAPCIVRLGTAYSYFAGFGILLVLVAAVGWLTVGWLGVAAFFSARVAAALLGWIHDFHFTQRSHALTGQSLTTSERSFFNAYRLHASRLGVTTDLELSDDEYQEDSWRPCFEDLAARYPEVVRRFTTT